MDERLVLHDEHAVDSQLSELESEYNWNKLNYVRNSFHADSIWRLLLNFACYPGHIVEAGHTFHEGRRMKTRN